jgi:hypothetical protein
MKKLLSTAILAAAALSCRLAAIRTMLRAKRRPTTWKCRPTNCPPPTFRPLRRPVDAPAADTSAAAQTPEDAARSAADNAAAAPMLPRLPPLRPKPMAPRTASQQM